MNCSQKKPVAIRKIGLKDVIFHQKPHIAISFARNRVIKKGIFLCPETKPCVKVSNDFCIA